MIRNIKNFVLDIFLKHSFIIATIITILVTILFHNDLVAYFDVSKTEILNLLISVSGTLFGFILTFLSVFIIFKTEDKYNKNKENESKPLIMLVNNKSFNEVYELFIKSSYSLGLLLVISLIYYFTTYGLNYIINFGFIVIIIELIIICVLRMFISIYTFNTLIRILIKNKQD